jgi:hypothetical protein
MANNLGAMKPVAATATIKKNKVTQLATSGAVIPFFNFFKQGANTIAPPAKWITRR